MSLKVFQIDGATFIAITEPRIVAAMMAFGYVWQELNDKPERTDLVVDNLNVLFGKLTALNGGSANPPPQARSRRAAQRARPKRPARRAWRESVAPAAV